MPRCLDKIVMAAPRRYFSENLGSRKRRRIPSETPEIQDRLESLISRVGEKSTSSLQSNLEGLAGVLEADIPSFKLKILYIMADCIVRMPEKCTIYSTLVGLINVKNYVFGGELVELVMHNLKDCLRQGLWDNARYLLRFLANLVNCRVVTTSSLLVLLNNFLEVLTEQESPQVRKDWYAYCVMSVLPWAGKELYEKKEPELDKLLSKIEEYMTYRSRFHVPLLKVWNTDRPHPQEEYLDCLWAQLNKMRNDFWHEKHILRPYQSFDSILCEALQHTLPPLQPPPHQTGVHYPLPWVVFRLFDYTDCPDGPPLPGAHAIERYLIDEQLWCLVQQFVNERKECAARLLSAIPRNQLPLDYAIVELLLGEMLKIPNSQFPHLFYSSVLMELCRLQPSTFPQVLAQAAELLYDRLDSMQPCCIFRLVLWFSHHLSNFQFRWTWEDWSNSLQQNIECAQPIFIREVFEACMNLSYYQRVIDFIPASFLPLAPEKPEICYSYSEVTSDGYNEAQRIQKLISEKCTEDELLALLQELSDSSNNIERSHLNLSFNLTVIDLFVQTLLMLGSKSMSHSFAAIAKFRTVLRAVCRTEADQLYVLCSLHSLWQKRPQMICILVDKLLKTQIISCDAVANWLFSKDMTTEFTRRYVWELLNITIQKMNKHVAKFEKELKECNDKLQQKTGMSPGSEGDENPAKHLKLASDNEKPTPEMIENLEECLEQAQSDQKNLFLIIFQHLDQVWKYKDTLGTLLFTPDLDSHILEIFRQVSALKS